MNRGVSPVAAARGALGRTVRRLAHLGGRLSCPVCGAQVRAFEPIEPEFRAEQERAGFAYALADFETLNADAYRCPVCRESDRSRLYALYLHERLGRAGGNVRFLDLAPSPALARTIRARAGLRYVSMDIGMAGVDVRASLTQLPLPDSAVDAFLCSHVLEHVRDEPRALGELYRVLRPEGWGILMVPILLPLPRTVELPEGAGEGEAWRLVGQGDHVRLHERSDFMARLQAAGFAVSALGVQHFGAESFERHGIAPRSVLYVVDKPAA